MRFAAQRRIAASTNRTTASHRRLMEPSIDQLIPVRFVLSTTVWPAFITQRIFCRFEFRS
jgi:hypothetical protein